MKLEIDEVDISAMTPNEAAIFLGLAKSTLAKLRCVGGGPEFLKLGRSVRYERRPLLAWRSLRRAVSTSDASRLPSKLTPQT
jgi:hypothetical protein